MKKNSILFAYQEVDGQQKSFDEVYKEKIFFCVGIDNTGNFPIKKCFF